MEKIKVGQIGICHEHAAGKMRTLRLLPDVFEIVGVVDERPTTAARFAGDDLTPYNGLKFVTEEELFNTPGLQAVTVETPNADLVPTALRVMEHKLAMHLDKPGGEELEPFGHLLRGCQERHLPFQMGYMFRNNPAMQWCLNAVRQGWLGEIFEVQAGMSHNYGGDAYQPYLGHFRGGIMFNLGCHLVDWVVAMLGRPENITPFLKTTPGLPGTIKNNGLAILDYPHATVTLRACSCEVDGLNRRRLKLCGTNGSVELCPLERFDGQPLQMNLVLKDAIPGHAAGAHTVEFGIVRDRYEDQLLEWAKIINGEMANPYTYEHDYRVQEVVLAAAGYTPWKP
ncbi:MAG: Gfo/Idh/MocA family oxidoreductase [Lentisphaeria bacterium]